MRLTGTPSTWMRPTGVIVRVSRFALRVGNQGVSLHSSTAKMISRQNWGTAGPSWAYAEFRNSRVNTTGAQHESCDLDRRCACRELWEFVFPYAEIRASRERLLRKGDGREGSLEGSDHPRSGDWTRTKGTSERSLRARKTMIPSAGKATWFRALPRSRNAGTCTLTYWETSWPHRWRRKTATLRSSLAVDQDVWRPLRSPQCSLCRTSTKAREHNVSS